MKKILILSCIILLNLQISICQTQSNIVTPKLSTVTAWILPEDSESTRAYSDWWSNYVYGITPITTFGDYSSSARFNCHAFAWYSAALTSPRWIGYGSTSHEDIYMTDGSYVQVLNSMYPGKVSFGSDDHSAITTSSSGIWKSKWGSGPLCEHAWNNSPYYNPSNVKYYVSTSITGSNSPLCNSSSRDFTVTSIPNASYSWSIGSGLTKSENVNSCTVYSNGYYTGLSWIEVTITSPIGGGQYDVKTSPRLYFWIGIPSPWITGPSTGEVGSSYYFYVHTDDLQGAYSNVNWGLSPSYSGNSIYDYDYCANAYFNEELDQIYQIEATVQNTCGTGNTTHYIDINYGGYLLSPNPASDEVTISVIGSDQNSISNVSTYNVSIINGQGILQSKNKYAGERFSIPLHNLKDGTYYIRIDNGKSVVNKPLIIKH